MQGQRVKYIWRQEVPLDHILRLQEPTQFSINTFKKYFSVFLLVRKVTVPAGVVRAGGKNNIKINKSTSGKFVAMFKSTVNPHFLWDY